MKALLQSLAVACLTVMLCELASAGPIQPAADRCRGPFIEHLKNNFDDIHDVSMRFHHLDHTLNGLIGFNMEWREGELFSFSVVDNETGNSDFAAALAAAMEKWNVKGMEPSCGFPFAFRIRIVGSDDPEYANKGILTGKISDARGEPVRNARIRLESEEDGSSPIPDGRSNREGIFVRTLIPPGSWKIKISCPGYENFILEGLELKAGGHRRLKVGLDRSPD